MQTLHRLRRSPLTCATLAALYLVIAAPLAAQDAPAQEDAADDDEEAQTLETVQVTGSRIARVGFVSPSPITTVSAEQIRASGATTLGDLLNQLPQLAPTFNLSNSSRFIGTVGVGLLDLRGIGTARTLVLVNGRRHVGATSGSTAVDTNTIPVEWIERIEVITGGASAVYGADAIAGVVNFILKDSIDGFEARVQYGEPAEGNFDRKFASFSGGSDFSEGRGNAAFSIEYSDEGRFLRSDRAIGRENLINFPNPAFDPSRPASQDNPIRTPQGPGGLFGFSTGGRFVVGGIPYIFLPDGSFRRQNLGQVDGGNCINCDSLDLNAVADLQPALERISFNALVNYDLFENHRLTAEFKYVTNKSDFQGQPSFDGNLRIRRDNPFISPALAATLTAGGVTAPASTFGIARFHVDAGQRGEEVERQTLRGVLALEGGFLDQWSYDLSAVYGETVVDRINTNNRINERFQAGLDAARAPNGTIVCRTTLDPAAINPNTGRVYSPFAREGCVPFSIFGDGAVTAAARDYFNVRSPNKTTIRQFVASGVVTNPSLFELPAGGVGFATGVEYRRESSREDTDPLSAAGLTFLNAIPSREGSYNVQEAFFEFSAPLLADLPAVQNLIFDVAGRVSNYDTIDSSETWRVGLDWTVIDDLRFRATRSKAVRAPSIGELFNPQSQNFAAIGDPCDSRPGLGIATAPNPALRRANCAALGVPANFIDQTAATTPGITGGNPDLAAETARSETVGFVWQPEFIDGFGLSVDYWSVDLADAINTVAAQTIANRCVDNPGGINNVFCNAISRAPAGGFVDEQGRVFPAFEITFFRAISENIARQLRTGYDFEASYDFEVAGGSATTRLVTTYYHQSRDFAFQDFPAEFTENVGTIVQPRWRANFTAGYRINDWRFNWDTRYIDRVLRVGRAAFRSSPGAFAPISFGTHVTHDLNVGYTFGDSGFDVAGGVDNVFDKDPPLNVFGAGGSDAIYDTIGRYFYVGLTYKF